MDTEAIRLEIPDDLLLDFAIEAHRRDMKLNDYIVSILEKWVNKMFDEYPELEIE